MDNRKQNTDIKIKEAFIALMDTKQPDKITAKELCTKAGINRSTFYNHFPYMEELLKDIIRDQIIKICYEEILGDDFDFRRQSSQLSRDKIRTCIRGFRNNLILKKFIMSDNAVAYVHIMIKEQVEMVLKNVGYSHEAYYEAYYLNVASTATVIRWLMEGERITEDQLIDIIQKHSVPLPQV